MASGWVRLYRKLLDDPVWTFASAEHKAVLVTILLLANHETRQWIWRGQKFETKPGQLITSLSSLAEKAGVSIQNVRSALSKLEKTHLFLTNESTKSGRLISIRNWDNYQPPKTKANKEANKEATTNKNLKNKPKSMNDESWAAFVEMRKQIKAPLTDRAETIILNKLIEFEKEGYDVNEVLDNSVINNWKDVFPPKRKKVVQLAGGYNLNL